MTNDLQLQTARKPDARTWDGPASRIREALDRCPRLALSHGPTPLERMERLEAALGGPKLWVKRDDCTGLATGGNKTRKLEYLVGEALAVDADTLITTGAVQSNHARQTAAAAAKAGLDCVLVLLDKVPIQDAAYQFGGNVLLDHLLGATIRRYPADADPVAEMERIAAELRAAGKRPYIIPGGGSNPVGSRGYVECALELAEQSAAQGFEPDAVIVGAGSAGTQAGLVAGLVGLGLKTQVIGVSVGPERAPLEELVAQMTAQTMAELDLGPLDRARIEADDGYVGPGYGLPTDAMVEAVGMAARLEALVLDPVYTGKAMSGLIGAARAGRFDGMRNAIFIHTGGSVVIGNYRGSFAVPGDPA
ncbi:D-cysteine desulfhydrase [Paracoccus suum]|uniref:D-cysteine desulfhydrase n=1 Tax=Paracoccus suum TaxID=2259340 RepID=A0A344PGE5_9RHOB|nr:D-cysteine desulfhydrase [Paracoccus suum]AXC48450.1 D-cysteine desulfhydrase [Paracoccus suum]